jgi:7-cyano-7-deazaguanine synthase
MSTSRARVRSIVLLSGGLDSIVCLAQARERTEVVRALTFDYGQRSARPEARAARACCRQLRVPLRVVPLPWLAAITRTALVARRVELPAVSTDDLRSVARTRRSAALVWVPNRNMVFVGVAAAFAETLGAGAIIAGFNAEEARTFPDNSEEFVRRINRTLQLSTRSHPRVISYTQHLSKKEIVKLGVRLGAPLEHLYSCYAGGRLMCGRCESCQRVKRAFRDAGRWVLVASRFASDAGVPR